MLLIKSELVEKWFKAGEAVRDIRWETGNDKEMGNTLYHRVIDGILIIMLCGKLSHTHAHKAFQKREKRVNNSPGSCSLHL